MKAVIFCAFALAMTTTVAMPAGADSPHRQLTYTFTYGMTQNTSVHNSGFNNDGVSTAGSGAGVDSYQNSSGRTGTVAVEIQREELDKGLVLVVSETVNGRTTPGAQCVVWGTGSLVCDPNATINIEEYSVLRFLGDSFVDPTQLDAKRHWQLSSNSPQYSATSDYTISKIDGSIMTIDEARKLIYRGSVKSTADVTSTVIYDFDHKMPTSIKEATSTHSGRGGQDRDQMVTVTATLASDSLTARKP